MTSEDNKRHPSIQSCGSGQVNLCVFFSSVFQIEVPDNKGRTYYRPKSTVQLQLRAKHQTKIALLAVDTAVYLLQDYHRLNKKKVSLD